MIIEDVVYEGGNQRRDALKASRLLFTSNFDGSLDDYLEAMRIDLGEDADAVWGHCVGYPGRADAPAFAAYFATTRSRARCSSAPTATAPSPRSAPTLARRDAADRVRDGGTGPRARGAAGALPAAVPGVSRRAPARLDPGLRRPRLRLPLRRLPVPAHRRRRRAAARCSPRRRREVLDRRSVGDASRESGLNIAFTLRAGSAAIGVRRHVAGGFPEEFRRRDGGAQRASSATSARAPRSTGRRPFGRGEVARAGDDQRSGPGRAGRARRDAARGDRAPRRHHRGRLPGRLGAARRRRALRLRRRLRPAVDRGQRRRPAARPGRAAEGRRLAADPGRRVHPRLPRRGGRDPGRAGARPADRQRHLPRLPQAAPGRRALPPHARATPPRTTRAARSMLAAKLVGRWRDGTPLDLSPDRPDPDVVADAARNNDFSLRSTTTTACAARSAATSAAPTRATAAASRASSSTATA